MLLLARVKKAHDPASGVAWVRSLVIGFFRTTSLTSSEYRQASLKRTYDPAFLPRELCR